jgi:uncharacterized ubiquitin-like protein YukD
MELVHIVDAQFKHEVWVYTWQKCQASEWNKNVFGDRNSRAPAVRWRTMPFHWCADLNEWNVQSIRFRATKWYHVKYFYSILKEVQRISIPVSETEWRKQCFMYDSEAKLLETKYNCFIMKGSNSKLLINFDLTYTIHKNKTFDEAITKLWFIRVWLLSL